MGSYASKEEKPPTMIPSSWICCDTYSHEEGFEAVTEPVSISLSHENSLTTSQCGKYNPVASSQCQRCGHEKCKKCTNLVKNEETGVRHPVCNCGRVGLVDGLWHGEVMGS
jgi:hypothetical protein